LTPVVIASSILIQTAELSRLPCLYELDPPKGKQTTVAVKIIDMLGEEEDVTKDV
jgi:hypothetical protein